MKIYIDIYLDISKYIDIYRYKILQLISKINNPIKIGRI